MMNLMCFGHSLPPQTYAISTQEAIVSFFIPEFNDRVKILCGQGDIQTKKSPELEV